MRGLTHPTTGYTSLVHGCEAQPARSNGIVLAGITAARPWGRWVQVRPCGVVCRLYLAGPLRSPAYESHPWRKGWPRCCFRHCHVGRHLLLLPCMLLVVVPGLLLWMLLVLGPVLLFRRRPHPPHARLVESECEVRIAPANGLYVPRWCMVRGLTRTCQRDRPRWYHSRPFVGMACMLYLAGSAACLAGSSRGRSCRISGSGVRGQTRTCQRARPR